MNFAATWPSVCSCHERRSTRMVTISAEMNSVARQMMWTVWMPGMAQDVVWIS